MARPQPTLDSILKRFGVPESLRRVFVCPTGSTRLFRSGAVEDELPILRQRARLTLQVGKRNRPFEMILVEFFRIVISADQQSPGAHVVTRLLWIDSLSHESLPPLLKTVDRAANRLEVTCAN